MKTRTTWLNEETACKIIALILIWGIFAMMLVSLAVKWQERELKNLEAMNNEIEEEIGDLEEKYLQVTRQELWAQAINISPIDFLAEETAETTEETLTEEITTETEALTLAEINVTEASEVSEEIDISEETETTEEPEITDEMLIEIEKDNSIEKEETAEEPETTKIIEESPVVQETKVAEPIVEPTTVQYVEVPVARTSTSSDEEFPYTIEDFLRWNGIDREFLIVTIAKVIYVEARGVERSGKVSVGATICHWGRSGRITNLWDILSGYAPISNVDYYALIWDPIEGETMKLCREAAEAAIVGEDPAGDMMGAPTYYFLDPSKSDPANVRVMTAAYHQVWIENQLFLGYEGVDWMKK